MQAENATAIEDVMAIMHGMLKCAIFECRR